MSRENPQAKTKRNAVKLLLSLFLTLLLCAGSALAQTITVVTEHWPPYSIQEDGHIGGVVTEVVRTALDRAGLKYTLDAYPWSRSYQMAQDQENVLIYSIFRLPSRENLFQWIEVPGLAVEMSLYRPAHRTDIHVDCLGDAMHYVVGVTRASSTHLFLRDRGFIDEVNLVPLSSEKQNILMTMPGVERTDFSTGDRLSLAHWLQQAGLPPDYLVPVLPLFQEEICLAFGRKTSPALVDRVRQAVDSLARDGTLRAILDGHHQTLGLPVP